MMYIHESEYHKYIGAGRLIKGAQIIELKVVLLDTEPEVWRKIAVPSNYTLEQLGRVAACAIGWIPRYFNFFGQNDEFIGGYDPYMKPEESNRKKIVFFLTLHLTKRRHFLSLIEKLKTIVARDIIISSLFVDEKTRDKSVTMDYGSDGWLHEITFEKLRDADKKHYPKCVDGKVDVMEFYFFVLHFL